MPCSDSVRWARCADSRPSVGGREASLIPTQDPGGLVLGQSGHRPRPVAATAMVWSAVADTVGLAICRFQRRRTGTFDLVEASDLSLRIAHTKHRHSGSQSRQRSTRSLQSESHGSGTGCVPTLDAGACGVTRRGTGFYGFLSWHSDEAQASKPMMHLRFLRTRVTRIFRTVPIIQNDLLDKLR